MLHLKETIQRLIRTAQPEGYKNDGSRYYTCPFCKGRKKLEVDASRPIWYCHKCGVGGTLDEKKRWFTPTGIYEPIISIPVEHTRFTSAESDSLLHKYLREDRGLSRSIIRELRPLRGLSPVRVYFPFYELGGTHPVYYIGRSILPCFPRYWNPSLEDFAPHRKSTVLWGLHRFQKPLPIVVICEGIFSACHEPNRVAVLGKTISDDQVRLIKQICVLEVVVCLDGGEDGASTMMADKLCHGTGLRVSVVHLPTGKDPDDLRDITPWFKQRERIA